MRKASVLVWVFLFCGVASAFATHFDVIEGGTLSVNNTSGQTIGPLADQAWADIATGSVAFDFGKVKLARLAGSVTGMVGHRESSWKGTWGTIGLAEVDWIEGDYIGMAGWDDAPNSYELGWVLSCHTHIYANGVDTYANVGARIGIEDTTNSVVPNYGSYKHAVNHDFTTSAFDLVMEWDMTDYAPAGAGEGTMWIDYRDPADGAGWYSEQNGGQMFPDAEGNPIGIRHGNWAPSDPEYYDDYTDTVIAISLVEDITGWGGSCTYTDFVFDIVGRVLGDANLDGVVTQADLDIVNANMGSTDAHWGMGDFTGGGVSDWGGLDGIVDAADRGIVLAALGAGGPGDLNYDGAVNSGDLDLVRANWGRDDASGTFQGDADGDGFVGSSDLDIVRANWGNTAAATIPEPSFLMLAAAGLLALAIRRK